MKEEYGITHDKSIFDLLITENNNKKDWIDILEIVKDRWPNFDGFTREQKIDCTKKTKDAIRRVIRFAFNQRPPIPIAVKYSQQLRGVGAMEKIRIAHLPRDQRYMADYTNNRLYNTENCLNSIIELVDNIKQIPGIDYTTFEKLLKSPEMLLNLAIKLDSIMIENKKENNKRKVLEQAKQC